MSTLEGKLWADLTDSDSEIEQDDKNALPTKNSNLVFTQKDIYELIKYSNNKEFQNKIHSLVTARIKNYSHIGLNKMIDNDLKDFDNIKIEFYYTKRKLKIHKMYNKISIEKFDEKYKELLNCICSKDPNIYKFLNSILQNCIVNERQLYVPFLKVDNKFYDLIKYYSDDKTYDLVLYPIQL